MADGFDMLALPIPGTGDFPVWLVIAESTAELSLDHEECEAMPHLLPGGWKARKKTSTGQLPAIGFHDTSSGLQVRLLETVTYEWSIDGGIPGKLTVKSTLDDNRRQRWAVRKRKGRLDSGRFTVVNHLGMASFELLNDDEVLLRVPLEFISKKIDFDTEYRHMTEDIANFCEQLLLTWEAPTSLHFSADATQHGRLLLERFLFLRNFLTDEKLGRMLEVIERMPHSRLIAETAWKPASLARSTDFLSDPGNMLRAWHRLDGRPVPTEVLDIRKEDTHDTAPNRFVKFALSQFRQLCTEVVEVKAVDTPVGAEAHELTMSLDAILSKRFFRDISRLHRIPLDNQTLQKGEGYREILRAWILTEAAASLNWSGHEESYEGSARDVATLYEYWIFIKLHHILENLPRMRRISGSSISAGSADAFISRNGGEILINLTSGKHSRSSFLLDYPEGENLRIDLHYERTFVVKHEATASASYSRQFRPDYTLTLFPACYDSEQEAELAGKVAHLHFDAKYRSVAIAQLFGDELAEDEESGENDSLAVEKSAVKSGSTYQRGDLLKMHTYNDALRQTIGSYVLYPGDTNAPVTMRKFHEIAPGVGALVMKPGREYCLDALRGFLQDVFEHQASRFTQFRYLADTRYSTIHHKPQVLKEAGGNYRIARMEAPCVILWLKQSQAAIFRKHGFAYCHAVPQGSSIYSKKLDLNLSTEIGSEFIPCGGRQGEKLKGLGWRAKIRAARFLSKEKLLEYIKTKGLAGELEPSSVDHYLLFEFEEDSNIQSFDLDSVHRKYRSGSKYMAVTCTWREIINSQSAGLVN